jgi:hypothetical protein
MKTNKLNFSKAMSIMLSFIPAMEKWHFAGQKMWRDPRKVSRGTIDRYAGMHPRRDHPHTQEKARRVRQGC